MALLAVDKLAVHMPSHHGPIPLVREVSFSIEKGETLGIVGESGCGKTMTALALMGLLPDGAVPSGEIRFEGENLLAQPEDRLCKLRGNRLAMIFQEPMSALNPVHPIGGQIAESLILHRGLYQTDAMAEAVRLLELVRMPEPKARLAQYPHQLSGGQRQRVMIAIALACQPDILIADEPTTALDVTVQAQILDLIHDLVDELGMALVLISHDLGIVGDITDRVLVMYAGKVVEAGPTVPLFDRRAHPYTRGLFGALPDPGRARGSRLYAIPGTVPDPWLVPGGCAFADRCPLVEPACRDEIPPNVEVGSDHRALCRRTDLTT